MLVFPVIPSFFQAKCLNVAVSLPKVAFTLTAHQRQRYTRKNFTYPSRLPKYTLMRFDGTALK